MASTWILRPRCCGFIKWGPGFNRCGRAPRIGTITESIDAVKLCKSNGWGVMCSHRSGETEDRV